MYTQYTQNIEIFKQFLIRERSQQNSGSIEGEVVLLDFRDTWCIGCKQEGLVNVENVQANLAALPSER